MWFAVIKRQLSNKITMFSTLNFGGVFLVLSDIWSCFFPTPRTLSILHSHSIFLSFSFSVNYFSFNYSFFIPLLIIFFLSLSFHPRFISFTLTFIFYLFFGLFHTFKKLLYLSLSLDTLFPTFYFKYLLLSFFLHFTFCL